MSNTFKPFVQTEKKFLDKIAKQDAGSLRSVTTIFVRFNMWTKLEHDSKAELFAQALATDFRETNNPERAFEMIQDYIDWCNCDPEKREVKGEIMSHIYFEVGSGKRGARRLLKISANTLDHEIWYILKYLRKVGGLTIDKYDFLDNLTMQIFGESQLIVVAKK